MNSGPMPGSQNAQTEEILEKGPEEVSKALLNWRRATLEREKTESRVYLRLKAQNPDKTATELKYMLHDDLERYEAVLQEISFEAVFTSKEQTLLAAKKLASLRTAF